MSTDNKLWVEAVHKMPQDGPDYTWAGETEECLCGCNLMVCVVTFEDKDIATYFLDMKCLACGALLKAPCLEDEDGD